LIDFYNQIALTNTLYCNGDNLDGEATADMGGVKIMLQLAKEIDGFDYDKFFRAFALVWAGQPFGMDYVEYRASDSHPFNYLRTNVTLAQFDEFIETYDIKPGDGMYVAPEQRINIW
jgi:putative endopeptidase